MAKEITDKMIDLFNAFTEKKGSAVLLVRDDRHVRITLKDPYLDMKDQVIIPTEEFYHELNEFFAEEDVEIQYNNVRSSFWAINTGPRWVILLTEVHDNHAVGIENFTNTARTVKISELPRRPKVNEYVRAYEDDREILIASSYYVPQVESK